MKKWIRNSLAAGAILTGSGLLLGVVGASLNDGMYWYGRHDYSHAATEEYSSSDNDEYESITSEMATESYSNDVVNSAYLSVSVGDVTIQGGDSFSFETHNVDKSYLYYFFEDGELQISYDKKSKTSGKEEFIIIVPRNQEIDVINFEGGVGNTYIQGVQANELIFSTGVGDVTVMDTVCNDFDLTGGVGNFLGDNLSVNDYVDISMGVGDVNLSGQIKGDTTVRGGVGSLYLTLQNVKPTDFNYNIEGGMSDVTINGETSKTFLSGIYDYNEDAEYFMDISGGLGSVDIMFSDIPATTASAEQAEIIETTEAVTAAEAPETATEQSHDSNGSNFTGYQSDFSSFSGNEPFTVTFKSKFEDFSGKYVVLEESLDSQVTRKIQWNLTDDDGVIVITLEKGDGTSEVLLSKVKGLAKGSKNVTLPEGENRIVVTASNSQLVDSFDLNLFVTEK